MPCAEKLAVVPGEAGNCTVAAPFGVAVTTPLAKVQSANGCPWSGKPAAVPLVPVLKKRPPRRITVLGGGGFNPFTRQA